MQELRHAGTSVLAIFLTLAAAAPSVRAQSPVEPARVVTVRIVNESSEVIEENPSLPMQTGQPLDAEAIRESLRELYRTGKYADIRAETTKVSGGMRLDFVVRPNLFINVVRVTGLKEPPTPLRARSALRLGLGEPFLQSVLDRGLARLLETMKNDGFHAPTFHPVLTPHPETRQMDITIEVQPGQRARLGQLSIVNPTVFKPEELLESAKLKPSQPVTAARLDRGAERLRGQLFKRGLLGARVLVHRGQYDKATNRLPVELEILAGPPVRVEVVGAKISNADLQRQVPVFQEGSIDEDLLLEGRRNLRDFFDRHGYFDSDVQYVSKDDVNGGRVITYTVKLGEHRRLEGISIHGNHYFSDETLRSRLSLTPEQFLAAGRFSTPMLHADEDSIRELYVANGFLTAQVSSEVLENYAGKSGDLYVRFEITEGPQTRVASLAIDGNEALDTPTLLGVLGSTANQPYSPATVAADRDNILALYYNEGFPEARFESAVQPAAQSNRMDLKYHITEGPRINVARVLLAGYQHTRTDIIRHEIEIQPGGPLRQGEVVETQRRLYDLGVFSRVDIAPQNPDGTESDKTLVVEVEEAKRFTIGYGGGVEAQRLQSSSDPTATVLNVSPRGIFELGWANFLGRAQTLAFKARASTLQGRALLSYTAPNLFEHHNLNFQLTGFADKSRDIQTFTSTRYEGVAQLELRHSTFTSFLFRYFYRKVLVDAKSLHINPAQVPLFSQPTLVSGFGFTWVRDHRDNPADPSRGRFWTADASLAARPLGSSATFARMFFQNSSYTPLGHSLVFARSTQVGFEEPFGASFTSDIPLPERFFAGGGNSLRGFSLNEAGPRDTTTGFPVGGLALLTFNQELRFPLRIPYANGHAGGAMFYDAGNVYSRASQITFRATPPPNDLNYLSHTVGVGVRYATPVGPVRVDFGYQLNPARYLLPTPTSPNATARLPAFQFFFTFGSSF